MKKLLEWKPVRFGLEVGELYFSKRVSRSAAELAYFLILTFFPVLICINAFIGLLHLDINAVLEAASPFLPRETLGILGDYIQYITGNQSPALLAAGGIMTLFSASAAFRALMNIMEDLYGRKSYAGVWRIAASVALSESACLRSFRQMLGITPIQYVKQFRVEKAAELLRSTRLKTGEIGAECGFTDGSYFIKIFREIKHCTPKEYRMKFC